MRQFAAEAIAFVAGKSRQDLDGDRVLTLAIVQLLQMLGEASRRVSRERCDQLAEIPWPQIAALRNRLIHGYDTINLDIVWKILTTDLPSLVANLDVALA
jgi:uncharacterized protein with HEPN domain